MIARLLLFENDIRIYAKLSAIFLTPLFRCSDIVTSTSYDTPTIKLYI